MTDINSCGAVVLKFNYFNVLSILLTHTLQTENQRLMFNGGLLQGGKGFYYYFLEGNNFGNASSFLRVLK